MPRITKPLRSLLLIISTTLFLSVLLTSFTSEPQNQEVIIIKQTFEQDIAALQQQAKNFTKKINLLKENKSSLAESRQAFYKVKIAYKQVEYLLEYLDPELAKSLNGAPLPKVLIEEANYLTVPFAKPSFRTFPPQGLQVLEELLFAEDVSPENTKEAIVLAYALESKLGLFQNSLPNQSLTTKQLLESLREELVRVMTLGITGFDAPAAGHELTNCAVALQPILTAVKLFNKDASGAGANYSQLAAQKLEAAIRYLNKHPDFDTFDRLYFIREILDPAYGALTNLQEQVLPESVSTLKPVNNKAISLFSPNFLEAGYYAKQDRQDQKPELIQLGKTLFFDPLLSDNNKRSCASCHAPNKAFADGLTRSLAFDFKGTVKRNSPTLLNAVFSTAYFWDSRAQYLQDQVPDVVVKNDELHGNYEEVVRKLQRSPAYKKMFKNAFPEESGKSLNTNTINRAVAAYVQNLVALNSPFDQYMRRETTQFDEAAKRGFNLFMGKAACGTCHFAPIFNGTVPPRFLESESEILGVPAMADLNNPTLDNDIGKAGVIPAEVFEYSFKTPTIRNAAVTAPYMHNGVFTTLPEVVEFYDRGGGAGLGMAVPHQTLPSNALNLSETEKQDLVAFMHSLTDTTSTQIIAAPKNLPRLMLHRKLNKRPVGGVY
ncbi:cytochrome c peroxidase [Adhaeribacter rhizoryzae]|uniref:cytochrome c peroxidase n=1 Tax=Adhaeribacter rhizoryzae TaxID=2607907 RepID=UPI00167FE1BB|nr:cytochrome c peroxidase [Adhaeribacter rhizoryzae]